MINKKETHETGGQINKAICTGKMSFLILKRFVHYALRTTVLQLSQMIYMSQNSPTLNVKFNDFFNEQI